jgi:serine/threonine protein kinase
MEEGVQVAWNELLIPQSNSTGFSNSALERTLLEIEILRTLKHPSIISLFHSWTNIEGQIFFITELMTSGTLKSFIQKVKYVKLKVIRGWANQIALGLNYLHSRSPPIIHRDLKCENIFINGNNGELKIGDLGLAITKGYKNNDSHLGTPEFMAPELYDEEYDEKVDIYAFGMCVLEMITNDYPYSECTNQAQIYKKVMAGIKPTSLSTLNDTDAVIFIEQCTQFDPKRRPTAEQLLFSPFLNPKNENILRRQNTTISSPYKENKEKINETSELNSAKSANVSPSSPCPSYSFPPCEVGIQAVHIIKGTLTNILVNIMYRPTRNEQLQSIKFVFWIGKDSVEDVVEEMVKEEILKETDVQKAQIGIERIVDGWISSGEESSSVKPRLLRRRSKSVPSSHSFEQNYFEIP